MGKDDFIIEGEPIYKEPDTSLGEFFMELCQIHDEKLALIDAITKQQLTFSELNDVAVRLAVALRKKGYKEGDVIGICGGNSIYYPIVILATFYIGGVFAPSNNGYSIGELKHVISLTKPKVIFYSPNTENNVKAVVSSLNFVREIIQIEPDNNKVSIQSLTKAVASDEVELFKCPEIRDLKDREALIMCSSGTTGLPKGVLLTHANVLNSLLSYDDVLRFESEEGFTHTLGVLPPFHVFGLMGILLHFQIGVATVVLPQFVPELYLQTLQDYKIKVITAVPPMLAFLAKHPLPSKYDLSELKAIFSGAAPVSKELEEAVLQRFPNIDGVRQGYGMTETTLGVLKMDPDELKPGSVGKIRPGTQAKVIDIKTKEPLGPNKPGELLFRGATIMKGYIDNPEATAETIDSEGWLHSGDIGYYDEEGWFFVVDRLKELIKYKGFQVPPAELEALLLTHPAVLDVAVIGIPDDSAGELPMAFVVKKSQVTEKELIDFVGRNVSNPKRLRGGVKFVDSIPKNPSGKILRRVLKERVKVTSKL